MSLIFEANMLQWEETVDSFRDNAAIENYKIFSETSKLVICASLIDLTWKGRGSVV